MTTQARARELAAEVFAEAGLGDHWSFGFDRARTRFGQTLWRPGGNRITLSAVLLPYRTEEQVDQTLRHEAAHALVGHSHGHNHVWLTAARWLGYTGSTSSAIAADVIDAQLATARYVGRCTAPGCTMQVPRYRAPAGGVFPRYVHKGCGGEIRWEINR